MARIAGTAKGEILRGPEANETFISLSIVAAPPIADPIITPARLEISGLIVSFASVIAISEAAMAYKIKSS